MAKVTVGDEAPDFELPGTGQRTYRLADYLGKGVILAFYPGDFSAVCTKQLCNYRDNSDRMAKLGVDVLGVSPQSVDSHERFVEEKSLNVPLLADEDLEVAERYGITVGSSNVHRSIFAIDGDGVIRDRHVALVGLTFRDIDYLEEAAAKL